ncbi:alpha/beta fold hydrolase [Pararhizobium sp. BT-229]|uniref:alpha/beta fold hydrolase n=1 Tax=Pararhizobium sp. BT-229 TaxID=2986923 RepID=UPI0021F76ACA|nr:alpha/beta hydrolase [Pararhizobium sp. BT-229]MCV9966387.1 alpha/beta fold hydrolase [Pararhizobium sp. BT-229]
MANLTIRRGEVELATEAFGHSSDPALLLIMGAMASMLWWPEEFCEQLAAQGRFVIRYDNRDTGLSTTYPPGEPGYTLSDMAEDAVAILDGYGIKTADIVGISLGGFIAQRVALAHPDRIRTLTVMSSSPLGIDGLPPFTDAYSEHAATGETVDWTDRTSVLDFMLRDSHMIAGTAHPHDAVATRRLIERDMDRARSFASATNHFMIEGGDGDKHLAAADLRVPLLVIHGTADPIFPIAHGEALANAVSGAKLQRIEGGGHELHRNDWPQITDAIAAHAGTS